MRSIYRWLVARHPKPFRDRFGEEMLDAYDDAAGSGWLSSTRLIGDGAISLLRQRLLRPARPQTQTQLTNADTTGVPAFHQFEDVPLRRVAVVQGVIFAVGLFGFLTLLLNQPSRLLASIAGAIGRPAEGLAVSRDLFSEREAADSEVSMPEEWTELQKFAGRYFPTVPLLDALDANDDFVLSPREIRAAPRVLAGFDKNGDGTITWLEAGSTLGPYHSVNRVLDRDHDGVLSATEIRDSAASLLALDLSGDGTIGTISLIPQREVMRFLPPGKGGTWLRSEFR